MMISSKHRKIQKKYRPALFDFLAYRALEFFENDESSIIQPVYAFELDAKEYFGSASEFKELIIETKDSLSLKFYAVRILQELISFHLDDKDPAPLIDADLIRLDFVHNYSTLEFKDSLYLESLLHLEEKFKGEPVVSDAGYRIALEYSRRGSQFTPAISGNFKWDKKKAFDKCNEIIAKYPESNGAVNCGNLKQQLGQQNIQQTIESVNVPDKPFPALIQFTNVSELWFKIIKIDYSTERDFRTEFQNQRDLVQKYNSFPVYQTWK